jgi:hypothetical protein
MVLAIVLALSGGLAYAVASVLQQQAAAQQAPELSLSPRLLVRLFRHPRWLLGTAVDVVAYLLEAAALGVGSVVVVGPLLVSGLLFAIPLGSLGAGRRVTGRDMASAVMVTVGLALFVAVGSPEGGGAQANASGWWLAGAAVVLIASVCVFVGRRTTVAGTRAALYGTATGAIYGLTAVLTKSTVDLFGDGVTGVFRAFGHWQPYTLVAASIVGLLLNQSAFQAGHVAASLPAISVVNPMLACIFGLALFSEQLGASGPAAWTVTTLSIIAMTIGTVRLARSPLVAHEVESLRAAPFG